VVTEQSMAALRWYHARMRELERERDDLVLQLAAYTSAMVDIRITLDDWQHDRMWASALSCIDVLAQPPDLDIAAAGARHGTKTSRCRSEVPLITSCQWTQTTMNCI
jgi:hypothetical protein